MIRATNQEGAEVSFTINTKNGQLNRLGSGVNIVYRGRHEGLGIDVAVKKSAINPKEPANKLRQAGKAAEASYFLSSAFTECRPRFNCFYGLVLNPAYREGIKSKILFEQVYRQAVFFSDQVQTNEMYYLYELVRGQDVDKLLKKTQSDIDYRNLGLQFLQALVEMRNVRVSITNANGAPKTTTAAIVHLDLKPSNLMIEEGTNILKIIDLNTLCFPSESAKSKCRQGMTFGYAGPESLSEDNSKKLLMASDIFAAGITLYEMITKNQPIKAESPEEWYHFWKTTLPEGSELDLVFPRDKEQWKLLIQRMVRRDYRERPTAFECLKQFKDILASEWAEGPGSSALPSEQGGGLRKTRNRKKRRSLRRYKK